VRVPSGELMLATRRIATSQAGQLTTLFDSGARPVEGDNQNERSNGSADRRRDFRSSGRPEAVSDSTDAVVG
jgi:hypothetical protein